MADNSSNPKLTPASTSSSSSSSSTGPSPATAAPSTSPISNLPQPHCFITAHYAHSPFAMPYTTSSFPPDLNGDSDLATHKRLLAGDRGPPP
ncbi:hypothetical protein VTK56DRAFT_5333 [Thermocarpiscus australiensis]